MTQHEWDEARQRMMSSDFAVCTLKPERLLKEPAISGGLF
jgi:hypothetical protein